MAGEAQIPKTEKSVPKLSDEDKSKDVFFERVARIGEEMKAKHGTDFAMGVFVLAARFLAEDKKLQKPD